MIFIMMLGGWIGFLLGLLVAALFVMAFRADAERHSRKV